MIGAMIDFLAMRFQQGDADGVLSASQAILNAIPDDLVALQFMALALLWLGHRERALALLRKAAMAALQLSDAAVPRTCERAAAVTLREARRPELATGWRQIAQVTEAHGLHELARRARRFADVLPYGERKRAEAISPTAPASITGGMHPPVV